MIQSEITLGMKSEEIKHIELRIDETKNLIATFSDRYYEIQSSINIMSGKNGKYSPNQTYMIDDNRLERKEFVILLRKRLKRYNERLEELTEQ